MPVRHPLSIAVSMLLLASAVAAHAEDAPASPSAITLDRIEVKPQLEAQIRAVDLKRDSDAILDAVSADDVGDYPDQNVAESLQRLPGVSVTRDQGEGRYVVVRGLDAALNSVSVDGIAIGTPESDNRAAPMDVIPSESTERLKVVKSPTPDMPGDSIGGAILVESASAFDRDGRSIRAKVEANHQSLSGKTSPKAAFNYSDLFADGTFGVALGVNYLDREFQSDNVEGEYDTYAKGSDDRVVTEWQRRKYDIDRTRVGANLNLDWRPDADNRYYLRTLFSSFKDAETRQRVVFGLGDGEVTALGNGEYRIDDIPADAISKRVRWRTKKQDTMAASFGGENRLADAVLDYRVGYTKTRERVNDEKEARFEYDGDDLSALVGQGHGIPDLGLSDSGWENNANYAFKNWVVAPKQVNDHEYSAQINARFDGENASYKFGLLGRWRDRDYNSDEQDLRSGPPIDLADWTKAAPDHRNGTLGQGISSAAMRAYWAAHGGEYTARSKELIDNALTMYGEDYVSTEDILSAYAMGTWNIGDLRVIAGARVENTQFDATGNRIDVAANGKSYTLGQVKASHDYTDVLPGLHLRWNGGEDWSLRFSANKTISRPGFGAIAPHLAMNNSDKEVEIGNPDLKPYKSLNLDASFEKYLGKSGILSLGLFHKSIDDYIVGVVINNDPAYNGYDVSTSINGDKAKVYGAEFNWQQSLDFLPAGWDGLLAGVSGTWLHTAFDPGLADREGEDFTLPRASKNVYTAFVGYEKGPLSTRVSAVHRSEYLDELGKAHGYDIYVAPNTQLDFSFEYELGKHVQLYFDASNLLDKPLERYQGSRSYTQQYEEYGRTYAIGLKVKL